LAMASSGHELELEQDLEFQYKSWRVQRVCWVLIALIVLAALLGLMGTGPLSAETRRAADGLFELEYERFVRMQAPSRLRVNYTPQAVQAGEARVWLDRSYVERTRLEAVVPQPLRVEIGEDRLTYVFAAQNGHPGAVTFHLQLQTFGRLAGRSGIGDAVIAFRQLAYP
jgi:hypothetical protein